MGVYRLNKSLYLNLKQWLTNNLLRGPTLKHKRGYPKSCQLAKAIWITTGEVEKYSMIALFLSTYLAEKTDGLRILQEFKP